MFETGETLKGSELPGIYKLASILEKDKNHLIDFGDIDLDLLTVSNEIVNAPKTREERVNAYQRIR